MVRLPVPEVGDVVHHEGGRLTAMWRGGGACSCRGQGMEMWQGQPLVREGGGTRAASPMLAARSGKKERRKSERSSEDRNWASWAQRGIRTSVASVGSVSYP